MFAFKKIYLIFVVFCFLICMTYSCAADTDISTDVGAADIENVVNVSSDVGTFEELNNNMHDLKSGDVYNFVKDYNLADNHFEDSDNRKGIVISGNDIVINGNGHVIDGAHHSAIFNLNGKNITVKNLTFLNGYDSEGYKNSVQGYNYIYSPVICQGNDCKILNCKFINNTGMNGGAIFVQGKNAVLSNNEFINNTATGVGGAIYLLGSEGYIGYSNFTGSQSLLSGEAIFLNGFNKNTTLAYCNFDNAISYIHDGDNNFDPCFLFRSSKNTYVDGQYIDIIPLMYKSIRYEGLIPFNDYILYSSEFQGNDFLFTINKLYPNSQFISRPDGSEIKIEYMLSRTFHFTDIHGYNDIFGDFIENCEFSEEYSVLVNIYGVGPYAYNLAVGYSLPALSGIYELTTDINPATQIKKLLIINLNSTDVEPIKCTEPWAISLYDSVTINGGGLTVEGSYDYSNEDKWVIINEGHVFIASNFIIKGFNNAIVNDGGCCIMNNVLFNNNKIDYWFDEDYGAAVYNKGVCIFDNCIFINGYAKYGGAIYNEGTLILNNCSLYGNRAYGQGNNIYALGGSVVVIDNINITKNTGLVFFINDNIFDKLAYVDIFGLLLTFVEVSFAFSCISMLVTSVSFLVGVGIVPAVIIGGVTAALIIGAYFLLTEKNNVPGETVPSPEIRIIGGDSFYLNDAGIP